MTPARSSLATARPIAVTGSSTPSKNLMRDYKYCLDYDGDPEPLGTKKSQEPCRIEFHPRENSVPTGTVFQPIPNEFSGGSAVKWHSSL